jgi:hypothetical protein
MRAPRKDTGDACTSFQRVESNCEYRELSTRPGAADGARLQESEELPPLSPPHAIKTSIATPRRSVSIRHAGFRKRAALNPDYSGSSATLRKRAASQSTASCYFVPAKCSERAATESAALDGGRSQARVGFGSSTGSGTVPIARWSMSCTRRLASSLWSVIFYRPRSVAFPGRADANDRSGSKAACEAAV